MTHRPPEQHIQRLLSATAPATTSAAAASTCPTRELLTFAMLAALGGCEPQLKGHVAANLSVGNDRARLLAVLIRPGRA